MVIGVGTCRRVSGSLAKWRSCGHSRDVSRGAPLLYVNERGQPGARLEPVRIFAEHLPDRLGLGWRVTIKTVPWRIAAFGGNFFRPRQNHNLT